MGFMVTTILFFGAALLGCLGFTFFYNKGPSMNLLHVTLVITAVVSCWMLWAIVYIAQMNPLINPILLDEE
ncbi:hypothetical protein SELMODRAFT_103411 [Selaginella moellendorffii]|uniref:Uncharacterized protein n=1 Tax=Selaginella moellendorffii TaxID=88036 RepID=D8RWT5_SELML|nr:V-type proton ATPase subunit e1 [Selaginella moellendorffii]EFJ05418.1 hypothetical protein SELMODRAFT_137171 [Selaginella moellendorffii]EFJ23146.1 hypothetical protein SELMODRAFT_103411 [Selaginella moellendorffii]|eukprot:XP_002975517.1 V-type proton ATPase subunit e1 [Selaginella moellendorffii]